MWHIYLRVSMILNIHTQNIYSQKIWNDKQYVLYKNVPQNTQLILILFFFLLFSSDFFQYFSLKYKKDKSKQVLTVLLRVWSCTAEVNGSFVIDFNRSRIWTLCSIRTHRNKSNGPLSSWKKTLTSYHILSLTMSGFCTSICDWM